MGRMIDLRDATWLGHDRAVGYSKVLAVGFIFPLVWFYLQAMGPLGSDFLAFWTAAKLTLAGASAYDPEAQRALQFGLGRDHWFPFLNPPPFLAVILPFGLLPYGLALPAWIAAGYATWLAVTRRLAPGLTWPIAVFPGAMIGAWHAQNGFVTAALFAGAILALRTRPFLAGLLFGALIVKPHLALLVPVALIAGREWRAFAGAAVSSLGLLALSLVAFGPEALTGFLAASSTSAGLLSAGEDLFLRMPTVYAAVMVASGSQPLALAVQVLVAGVMVAVVWRAWRSADNLYRGAVLVLATVLSTPYLFHYDLVVLILPILWLARQAMRHGWRPWEKVALAILYWSPFLCRAFSEQLGFNLACVLLGFSLWLVVSRANPSADRRTLAAPALG